MYITNEIRILIYLTIRKTFCRERDDTRLWSLRTVQVESCEAIRAIWTPRRPRVMSSRSNKLVA